MMTKKQAESVYRRAVFYADSKYYQWLKTYGEAKAMQMHQDYCQQAWDKVRIANAAQ